MYFAVQYVHVCVCMILVRFECFESRDRQQAVQDHSTSVIDQQQQCHTPAVCREDFPRTGSESKVRINRYTKFFAICAEAEAVEAEGKECHQQANDVTAGTTTKQ